MLSRNYSSVDKRNGPQAVPKSSESSYIETFSLFALIKCFLGIEAYGLAFAMQTLFLYALTRDNFTWCSAGIGRKQISGLN